MKAIKAETVGMSSQRLARIDRQIELTERRFAERATREEAQHKAQLTKMAAESAAERKVAQRERQEAQNEARRERKEARQEARTESNIHWRWLYGLIITSSVALGGYLSLFITSYLHVH